LHGPEPAGCLRQWSSLNQVLHPARSFTRAVLLRALQLVIVVWMAGRAGLRIRLARCLQK